MTLHPSDRTHSFLDPRTLAKLGGLKVRAGRVLEGFVAGLHRSPKHGFSIEFSQHRDYSPGDNLRYVDWKAFGRSDKLYVKQFEDEANLICNLLLDVSQSMTYVSDPDLLSKWEYAQTVAASLAWLVLKQRDAVGLITFDEQVRARLRTSTTPTHLKPLIATLEASRPHQRADMAQALHQIAERLRRRALIVLISDFLDDLDDLVHGLKHLRYLDHEVRLLRILDPAEVDFPFQQPTLFKGLETSEQIVADARALRIAYQEEFSRHQRQLVSRCRDLQVEYIVTRTDQPVEQALAAICGPPR